MLPLMTLSKKKIDLEKKYIDIDTCKSLDICKFLKNLFIESYS